MTLSKRPKLKLQPNPHRPEVLTSYQHRKWSLKEDFPDILSAGPPGFNRVVQQHNQAVEDLYDVDSLYTYLLDDYATLLERKLMSDKMVLRLLPYEIEQEQMELNELRQQHPRITSRY